MGAAKTFSKDGKSTGTSDLSAAVFGDDVKEFAVHAVVTGQLRNERQGTAKTKERSELSYSTRKPWRQKGTGRARAGGRNSPIWRGGGTVFGPRPKNWNSPIPRKLRRIAMRSIVLDRSNNEHLMIVDDVPWTEPKTKVAVDWLKKLDTTGATLIVTAEPDENGLLSTRNIQGVTQTFVGQLSARDLASHKTLVFTKDAFAKLEEVLS